MDPKRETITLAIDKEIMEQIRLESKSSAQSINSAVNNILAKHVLFYRYAEHRGNLSLNMKSVRRIVHLLDEDRLLDEFKSNLMDTTGSYFIELELSINIQNFIKYGLEKIGIIAGYWQAFSAYKDGEGYTSLLFRHDYGGKWSQVLSEGISSILEENFHYHTNSKILPSSVLLRILEKDL